MYEWGILYVLSRAALELSGLCPAQLRGLSAGKTRRNTWPAVTEGPARRNARSRHPEEAARGVGVEQGGAPPSDIAGRCCVGGIFLPVTFRNGFSLLIGDRYDGVIEVSILEHWFNVVRGHAHWATTNYFFPAPHTLGYNDGYLLFGLVFSGFRLWGLDPYLSSELVNVVLRAVGFVAFYILARRLAALSVTWALFAAILFTIANNLFVHAYHAQLFSVCFVPVIALLLDGFFRSFWLRQSGAMVATGGGAAALYGAWLLRRITRRGFSRSSPWRC